MISFRKAVVDDAESLLSVRHRSAMAIGEGFYDPVVIEAWAPKVDSESVAKERVNLVEPCRHTIIAQKDGEIIGLCTLDTREALIKQCYVLPDYRNLGIAAQLMNKAEQLAKDENIESLRLSSTLMAKKFYNTVGYHDLYEYDYELNDSLSMRCIIMEKKL